MSDTVRDFIRQRGRVTVAAFMERALYDSECGYYARAGQRSGRAGDFFTSVDVGPAFGELLELQIDEMFELARPQACTTASAVQPSAAAFDLVEAGAGNGRLSADILRAARARHPEFYDAVRLHLVEASAAARAEQRATLGDVSDRLISSAASLPESFDGVLIANELLDAMPAHQVTMTTEGLREIYVESPSTGHESGPATRDLRLATDVGPLSTPRLEEYLARVGATLEIGWKAEINLNAIDWIRDAARRLRRGFMVLIDYGHEARDLYSASHSAGTLTTFRAHRANGGEAWLQRPGEQDITSHVDWTSVRAAAEDEGMATIAFLDQTYFLLGLLSSTSEPPARSAQLKTLLMPGGLGSTMKVLILGKGVGTPAIAGASFKVRVT